MKRRRRILMGLAGLIALLLASLFPAYQAFLKWDFRRMDSLARQALAEGDYPEARRLAQEILRVNQTDDAMLKVLYAAMVAQNDPKAAEIARHLTRHSFGTAESRLDGFRKVCADLPLPRVFQSWLTLPAADRQLPGFLTAFVSRLIEQEMPREADELLRQNPSLPDDPELQGLQARNWLAMGGTDELIQAQQRIAELMEQGGATALPAFRLLAQVPQNQFRSGYFLEIAPWLEQQAAATPADHLLGRIQQLQRMPDDQARIVAEAIQTYGAREPVACARWLRGLGLAREALELGLAAEPVEWAPVKAELLADLGYWSELEDWLATAPAGLTAVDIATQRAIAAGKLGDSGRSRSLWESVLREARMVSTSNALLAVAAQTRAAGMEEMSREALLEAVMLRRGRLPFWSSLRHLLPWLRQADRSEQLASLCQIMAEIDFTTPEPRLEAIDLNHLLGRLQPAAALSQLELLAKNYPPLVADPRYHEVCATVFLGDGKPNQALTALDDSRQSRRPGSPRRAAVTTLAKAALASPIPSPKAIRDALPTQGMTSDELKFHTGLIEKLAPKPPPQGTPPSPPAKPGGSSAPAPK